MIDRIAPRFGGRMTFMLSPTKDKAKIDCLETDKFAPNVMNPVPLKTGPIALDSGIKMPTVLTEIAQRYGATVRVTAVRPEFKTAFREANEMGEQALGARNPLPPDLFPEVPWGYVIDTQLTYRGKNPGQKFSAPLAAKNKGNTKAVDQAIMAYLKQAGVLSGTPGQNAAANSQVRFRYDPDA